MEEVLIQFTQFIGMLTFLMSSIAYGYIIYIILWHIAPKLITSKITLKELVGYVLAFLLINAAIEYAPSMIAESMADGFSKAMPHFIGLGEEFSDGLSTYSTGSSYAAPETTYQAVQPVTTTPPAGTHTVSVGDTVGTIATQHGVSVQALESTNGIQGSTIVVGQSLTIPTACTYLDINGNEIPCPPVPE